MIAEGGNGRDFPVIFFVSYVNCDWLPKLVNKISFLSEMFLVYPSGWERLCRCLCSGQVHMRMCENVPVREQICMSMHVYSDSDTRWPAYVSLLDDLQCSHATQCSCAPCHQFRGT